MLKIWWNTGLVVPSKRTQSTVQVGLSTTQPATRSTLKGICYGVRLGGCYYERNSSKRVQVVSRGHRIRAKVKEQDSHSQRSGCTKMMIASWIRTGGRKSGGVPAL
jgi:hypothetical protein